MKKRNASLDVIRILAFLLVVSVHSMLNGGFYYERVVDPRMIVMTSLRAIFMCCVPLFMVLSGYLTLNKKYDKSYYSRILRIIFVYVISSLFCELYRVFFEYEPFELKKFVLDVLAYKAAPYSWYIHMYLGLFLLFPFFNYCWHGIAAEGSEETGKKWDPVKKKRAALVLSLLALTALPSLVNTYDLGSAEWWSAPASSSDYTQLIPQWWVALYPISYYFIGAWFRTYPPKKRKLLWGLLTLGFAGLFGLYDFYRSRGATFVWGAFTEHYGFQSVILTCLIFAFWLSVDADRLPKPIKSVLGFISELTLGAYLTSWIFDQVVYKKLEAAYPYPAISSRFIHYPVCILISAGGALVLSALIWLWWKILENGAALIKSSIKNRKKKAE